MLTQTSQIIRSIPSLPLVDEGSRAGVNHLIAAAVVDSSFRKLLLADPVQALEKGYYGQLFRLTHEERRRILSIQAGSLPDFARQLLDGDRVQQNYRGTD